MERYISNNTNRNQISLIPMSLDEMISEDNIVRVLDAFVGSLNLNEFGFKLVHVVYKPIPSKTSNTETHTVSFIFWKISFIKPRVNLCL